MVELNKERMEQILHEETMKKEDQDAILRGIYTRYMRLYEKYLADIDALNDEQIAEMREYHEETRSLVKYYYMDIPQDVGSGLREFEKKYSDKLLGDEWHKVLSDSFEEYKKKNKSYGKSEKDLKAAFTRETLEGFYDTMDYIFRSAFGTESETAKNLFSGITGLLFGGKKE